MDKYLTLAAEAALKAGRHLKHKFKHPKLIKYKGEIDLVTDSDIEAQEIIIKCIRKVFPSHNILAEENFNTCAENAGGYRWIIDPIDGTTNFAHGYPFFAVSIALEHDGNIIAGAAYNPMMDELFTAQLGKGAYLNGKKIHVSPVKQLSKSLLVTGFPYDIKNNSEKLFKYNDIFLLKTQGVRRDGSAVLNLCYTACGRFDGFWEFRLKPWDTASGYLILKEAGGRITDFSGKKYNVYKKEILATNSLIHNQMLSILKP